MREYPDDPPEDDFPYAKPSVSAWVTAAAVALAVFVLGGFIKTYRQLDALREESRREINDLRSQVETLKNGATMAIQPPARESRIAPLPQARQRLPRQPDRQLERNSSQPAEPQPRIHIPEIDDTERGLTYSFGRSSRPSQLAQASAGLQPGAGSVSPSSPYRCQVIAVNNVQKRLMVEGGENVGLNVGSRLELSRQGRWIGDLRVLEVFDNLAACEVLHATLPPEPGDIVRMP
ncbi:MAG: hypothetical protein LIP23_06250 [Planctomycetes bacterium]|nr:hypothetical protein [Planctomycetota bacterium]